MPSSKEIEALGNLTLKEKVATTVVWLKLSHVEVCRQCTVCTAL